MRKHLNIGIVGHVDVGYTTLSDRIVKNIAIVEDDYHFNIARPHVEIGMHTAPMPDVYLAGSISGLGALRLAEIIREVSNKTENKVINVDQEADRVELLNPAANLKGLDIPELRYPIMNMDEKIKKLQKVVEDEVFEVRTLPIASNHFEIPGRHTEQQRQQNNFRSRNYKHK